MLGKLWRKFVNRESVTYIIFGVLTTAVDWVTYTLLWRMGTDYRVSTALSWAAAVLFAFITNKLFVFRSFGMRPGLLWREFSSFVAARAATGVFTMVAMIVMVDGLRWNEFFGKLVVSAVAGVKLYIQQVVHFQKGGQAGRGRIGAACCGGTFGGCEIGRWSRMRSEGRRRNWKNC